jgi:hypothetical protein
MIRRDAVNAYNKKRKEYEDFGTAYGFKNLGTALGTPATIPSIMRGGAGGGIVSRGCSDNVIAHQLWPSQVFAVDFGIGN